MDDQEPEGLTGELVIRIDFGNAGMQWWHQAETALGLLTLSDHLLDNDGHVIDENGNSVGIIEYDPNP